MKEIVLEQAFYNLETVGLLLHPPKNFVNLKLASQHLFDVVTDTLSYIEGKEPSTKPQLPEIGELLGILRAANADSDKRNIETEYERMLKMYEITLRLMASVGSQIFRNQIY